MKYEPLPFTKRMHGMHVIYYGMNTLPFVE